MDTDSRQGLDKSIPISGYCKGLALFPWITQTLSVWALGVAIVPLSASSVK